MPAERRQPGASASAPSSAISRFAVAAGLAALDDARLKLDAESAARTALIFAISNGGVIYTKRFYHEIVESGAQAASPLLFPETVFNAPASHLAAILGITGASYTLVGDGAVGILALKMAEDLMAERNARSLSCGRRGGSRLAAVRCLSQMATPAFGAADRTICSSPPRGMILSEGAGAVLLSRDGSVRSRENRGRHKFSRNREAARCSGEDLRELCEGEIRSRRRERERHLHRCG